MKRKGIAVMAAVLAAGMCVPTLSAAAEPQDEIQALTEFTPDTLIVEEVSEDKTNVTVVDESVAEAQYIKGQGMTVTSVSAGTTEIKCTNAQGEMDRFTVTVSSTGAISISDFVPWDGWYIAGKDDNGNDIKKYNRNGLPVTGWVEINNKREWYHFDDNGMQDVGWFQDREDNDNWYYLDPNQDGMMQRGWLTDTTGWKTYYLDSNGRMQKDQWVNAGADNELGRPAGYYKLTADGAVQMNGWAPSVDNPNIEWFCNPGTGLFEVNNPKSWRTVG